MKRFIVILLLLILVGGGGAGALIMLGVLPNPLNPNKHGGSASEMAAAEADAKAKAKAFKAPSEALTFVVMRDMILPVVSSTKVERTVYLSVRLSVEKSEKKMIEDNIVRYENAVLDEFLPYLQRYFTKHDMLNPVEIKAKLNVMAKKLYGDKVLDVMLVNVFEQKFGTLD